MLKLMQRDAIQEISLFMFKIDILEKEKSFVYSQRYSLTFDYSHRILTVDYNTWGILILLKL